MANYRGPAILTLEDGTERAGTVVLRTTQSGLRTGWQGTFVPTDGKPVNPGTGAISFDGRRGEVLIQTWRFEGGRGSAVLIGQHEAPF